MGYYVGPDENGSYEYVDDTPAPSPVTSTSTTSSSGGTDYGDYGSSTGVGSAGTSYTVNPDGTITTNNGTGGGYGSSSTADTSGISGVLKSLFSDGKGGIDLLKLGALGGGLAGLLGANKSSVAPTGYQGGIPKYTATRSMVTAPQAGRRPGAGGTRYGGDVIYSPKGSAPTGGLASLVNSGVVGDTSPAASTPAVQQLAQDLQAINTAPVTRAIDAPEVLRTINPNQAAVAYAGGGLASGRYLQGTTDGMADKIPAQIGKDQPAALSHGEFVIPADVVSHLGNGNSDAGAEKLYSMMDKIRQARTGTKKQGKEINPDKFMPGGLAKAYADGGSVSGLGTAANAGVTGTESNLSNWVGPYVTDMLGKGQALSEMPYQEYGGPLTAGTSPLQEQAFNTAGNLSVPGSVGTAAQTAGDIANKAQNLSYTPAQFGNQFQAPTQSAATNFTNQFKAPTDYQNTAFTSGTFGNTQAQQYMNPYLQQSLNPQLAEARRQADITEQQNKAAMTKAGAFGGGRQAILTAEGQRNLGTNLAGITGKGYDTAYQNAMAQFNADQARNLQAQQASEQSKQFGASQGMTAAQMMAQYGMSAQQAQEAARQFQQNQAMTGAQSAAQYGLAGQQAGEASRQFGANYGLQGLNTGLQAAQTQGNLGISSGQLGLQNLAQQLAAGQQQRGIESEGIAADKAAFEEARANPYKMVQFQQSLLSGLPLAAQQINTAQPTTFQQTLAGAGSVASLMKTLGLVDSTTPTK